MTTKTKTITYWGSTALLAFILLSGGIAHLAHQPDGVAAMAQLGYPSQLQLALNDNPAAKAYQQAMFKQGQPAAMFFTNDLQADHERMKARGAEFAMPPTDVTGSKIAKLNDSCGNLIQVTQLVKW